MLPMADPLLFTAAGTLDDMESARKAAANRLRQLTRSAADKDGELRGFGLSPDHPDVRRQAEIVAHLKQVEHEQELYLGRVFRRHPLRPWQQFQAGVGEKQLARLLAEIGDPAVRPPIAREDGTVDPARPRGLRELYALCGLRPGQRRQRGVRSNWSTAAKTRAYLVAESCIKQNGEPDKRGRARPMSPFRLDYDRKKAHYDQVGVHLGECIPCGPKGAPAQPGSPLPQQCKHMRSLRFAAKMLLRALWRESRRLHEQAGDMDETVAAMNAAVVVPAEDDRPDRRDGGAPDAVPAAVRFRAVAAAGS